MRAPSRLLKLLPRSPAGLPEVREADRKMLAGLRRWGRLVPLAPARRAILRRMFATPAYRRQVAGTFQISTVPTERAFTSTFVAAGVLVAGGVWPQGHRRRRPAGRPARDVGQPVGRSRSLGRPGRCPAPIGHQDRTRVGPLT